MKTGADGNGFKMLLIGLLMAGSFSALAGQIVNRATDERIHFDLNTETKEVRIELVLLNTTASRTVTLQESDEFIKNNFEIDEYTFDNVDTPLAATRQIIRYMKYNEVGEEMIGAIPLTIAIDAFFLPITVPVSIFRGHSPMNVKRDMKLLRKMIMTDKVKTTNDARFKRLKDYVLIM